MRSENSNFDSLKLKQQHKSNLPKNRYFLLKVSRALEDNRYSCELKHFQRLRSWRILTLNKREGSFKCVGEFPYEGILTNTSHLIVITLNIIFVTR